MDEAVTNIVRIAWWKLLLWGTRRYSKPAAGFVQDAFDAEPSVLLYLCCIVAGSYKPCQSLQVTSKVLLMLVSVLTECAAVYPRRNLLTLAGRLLHLWSRFVRTVA